MFRLVRSLIEIAKAGHLAYPILVSTGIHTTLFVALGMIVAGTSPGPQHEAVALAVDLGSGTGTADGDLDATPISAGAGSLSDGDDDALPSSPDNADFAPVEMQPIGVPEGDAPNAPPLTADLANWNDSLAPPSSSQVGQRPTGASAAPGASVAKKGSGSPSGKSAGVKRKAGGKLAGKGGKGGKGSGKGAGKDSASGAGGSSFFGFSADSSRVVFVVDVSGSMHGKRIRRAQTELRQTLEALKPSQKFYIVFFSDGAVPMPAAGLLSATSDNVAQASQWVQQAQCGGGTNPLPALLLALDLKPDAIYLLTDGKFPGQVLLAVTQDPPGHRTPIYTIAFASKKAERLLKAIANETGGGYRFVP